MKIGFVLCEHPVDVRIKKEARSLAAAGHEVVALVQEQPTNQRVIPTDGLTLQTYAPPRPGEVQKALTFVRRMSFLSIPVEERIEKFAVESQVDVLHVHDLPNVWAGIRVGRRLGIPVVADLHENYASAVRAYVGGSFKLRHLVTANQTLWHNYQRRCVRAADRIVVVIEEGRDYMLRYGIEPEKVHVVPNYVDLEYLRAYSAGVQLNPERSGKFVLSYVGYICSDRGVDIAIRAMALLEGKAPDAKLVVVGDSGGDTGYLARLRNLVKELGVEDSVALVGWQPFEKVPGYIAASDVGLVPHQRNPHRDNTIPNKLFDYMGFAKPVIVSDCPPLARIVNDARAGLVFHASRPDDLAECILRLYENRELARRLGMSGAEAVKERYDWNTAAAELVKMYDGLSKAKPTAAATSAESRRR
ncbi:MAG TPA: glycosyltransferase family 4 protein [Armatimonadota bacterium]|nr:glycosyltransferase family 4 protein [Armatimonadota bacterium]